MGKFRAEVQQQSTLPGWCEGLGLIATTHTYTHKIKCNKTINPVGGEKKGKYQLLPLGKGSNKHSWMT